MGRRVLTAAAAAEPGGRRDSAPLVPAPGPEPGGGRASRDGLYGEAACREGAARRHGAADSSHRGEPEPAVPHGARPAGGRAGGAGRPRAARGLRTAWQGRRSGDLAQLGGPSREGPGVAVVLGLGALGAQAIAEVRRGRGWGSHLLGQGWEGLGGALDWDSELGKVLDSLAHLGAAR